MGAKNDIFHFFFCIFKSFSVYLGNLLTHTLNNLLQKLNYVKQFQYSVGKQNINSIHIICENFRIMPWILCKIQLI